MSFYQKNKALPLFVLLTGFMAVTTVLLTGSGAKSHESPFFTLYFFILVLVLSNAKLSQHLKNWEIYIFIAAFLLPQSVDFAKKELKIYLIDRTNQTDAYLPEKVAAELKKDFADAKSPTLGVEFIATSISSKMPVASCSFAAMPWTAAARRRTSRGSVRARNS